MEETKKIIIAKIGASYQLKGYFKLYSWAEPIEDVFNLSPWLIKINPNQISQFKTAKSNFLDYLKIENEFYSVQLEKGKAVGKNLIAKLKGINSPEEARILTHSEIFVPRASLTELAENQYYWCDLIGLEVINLQNQKLGQVSKLIETKANSLLEVEAVEVVGLTSKKQKILIPFLPNFIKEVDLKKAMIKADWQEDFLT